MGKRIFLFLLTNMMLIVTVSIICSLFNIIPDQNLTSLAIYSGVFGFMSAFISLWSSKFVVKFTMRPKIITKENASNDFELWLYSTVESLSTRTTIRKMPEVCIYNSHEMNAFATGPSKNNSLVAVSTGLIANMNKEEIKAVLAHEVSHIENGDMVTMTLISGVINSIVIFGSRIIARIVSEFLKVDSLIVSTVIYIAVQIAIGMLCNIVVMYFSRKREYAADRGAASLVGNKSMIDALRVLGDETIRLKDKEKNENLAYLFINDNVKKDSLFSTHPSIQNRINALNNNMFI